MVTSQLPVTIMTRLLHDSCADLIRRLQWECSAHAFALVVPSDRDKFRLADDASGQDAVTFNQLANGCVLCNVDKDLSRALDELLHQHAAGQRCFGRVVVVSRPDQIAAVAEVLFTHEAIGRSCMLDAIVLSLDTADLERRQSIPSAWAQYIAMATHVVITNTARLCEAALAQLRKRIARINQNVRVHMPARSAPIDQIVYLGATLHW